jgi:cytochrome oxidase Cu insertion factor (SCO1/SenC/PrrC family)
MTDRIELRWRWLAVIAACSCALGVLAGLAVHPQARASLFGGLAGSGGTVIIGGPFELTDQNGRRVAARDFRGRPLIVVFGYTRDPDQTPAVLQVLARALERLAGRADRPAFLFITLDPAHDTPQVLARFLGRFHPAVIGLTGGTDEITAVAKSFRLPLVRTPDATESRGYSITYDTLIFLMNSQGSYVSHLDLDANADQVVHRLEELL